MIRRAPKDRENPYAQVNRALLQNRALSFQARGLLAYVLSKPRNWQAKDYDLMKEGGIGKAALRTILDELKAHGHACRVSGRSGGGKFEYDLEIYEDPQPINEEQPLTDYRSTDERQAVSRVAAIDSTRAGAFSSSDQKELNTQETSVRAPLPEGPGEDNERYTPARANEIASDYLSELPPESSFGNVLALTKPPAFDAADSRRKSLAVRAPSKGRRPKAAPLLLYGMPDTFDLFAESLTPDEVERISKGVDFRREERRRLTLTWYNRERFQRETVFKSRDAMLASLHNYILNTIQGTERKRA